MSTDVAALQDLSVAVRDAVTDRHPLEAGATVRTDGSGWRTLVDLGVTGLGVSEEEGGSGGGLVEQAVVLMETSRVLLPAPYLTSCVLALPLLPAGHPLRAGVASGDVRLAVAWSGTDRPAPLLEPSGVTVAGSQLTGEAHLVVDLRDATDVLVLTTAGLWHVPGGERRERRTVDVTRSLDDLVLDGVEGAVVTDSPDVATARSAFRVGIAAEATGIASRCVELAIAHARTREAFGRPIGVHQAIAHPLVESYADAELARSSTTWAAQLVADGSELAATAAASACVTATAAAVTAAERAIQTFGGVGFTWEHVLHRLYKRSLGLLQLGGTHAQLVDEVAAAVL